MCVCVWLGGSEVSLFLLLRNSTLQVQRRCVVTCTILVHRDSKTFQDNENDNDHSFNQLSAHKALTCDEGQSA